MKKDKTFKLWQTRIVSFMLGAIFTAVIYNSVEDYFNRPRVRSSINCLNFFINEDKEFILEVYLKHYNSGKTNTSIFVNELDLQLAGVNKNILQFDCNKTVQIDALSYVDDTLRIVLPNSMDTISNIPSISCLKILSKEISRNKIFSTLVDSTNVIYATMTGLKIPENTDTYNIDSDNIVRNGISKITFRKVPIEYKNKTYVNFLYPREADYSYKLVNGRIVVRCHYSIQQNLSQSGGLLKPIIFMPAKEIEDIVDLPNGYQLCSSYEVEDGNKLRICNYNVDIKDYSKQIVYFLDKKNYDR